jgi:hypothetical protein
MVLNFEYFSTTLNIEKRLVKKNLMIKIFLMIRTYNDRMIIKIHFVHEHSSFLIQFQNTLQDFKSVQKRVTSINSHF